MQQIPFILSHWQQGSCDRPNAASHHNYHVMVMSFFLCCSSDFVSEVWLMWIFWCAMSAYYMHNLSASFSVFCFCDDYCLCSSLDEADVHISTGCQDDLALLTVNGKKSRQEICWIFFFYLSKIFCWKQWISSKLRFFSWLPDYAQLVWITNKAELLTFFVVVVFF